MKKIAFSLSLFCAAILAVSCSEDKADYLLVTPAEENPFPDYLAHYGFDQHQYSYIDDNNSYEMGFSFEPLVDGEITALVIKLPAVHASLRVTIWDKQTALPIRTEFVNFDTVGIETEFAIDPLTLETSKEYLITMNSDDYYLYVLSEEPEPITYPFVTGNIRVTGSRIEMSNSGQIMPPADSVNATAGTCSFKFKPTP